MIWGCRFAGRASCSLQCGTAFAGTGADAARSTGGEHVSRLHGLSGPNAHCVGSIVVDCKGEESEGSFTRACVKLKKELASSAPPQGAEQVALAPQDEARYRNERLRAHSDFLLAVVQLSTFWMPFDASAFTLEAEAAEEEVVAAETRTLTLTLTRTRTRTRTRTQTRT